MKKPTFTPSKYLGEFKLPCLVAEMKNSDVAEVGTKYIADFGEDHVFAVYLRVKDTETMSPWMREKVEELFERDGLPRAISTGLKELDADGYDFLPENEREFVKTHGYHPCVFIKEIILDEIKEKVLISLGDISVLSEHGMTIHLKAGRWRFADGDPFSRYLSGFEKYRFKPDIQNQKWNEMFPKETGGHFEKDCSVIFGRWGCDQFETDLLRKDLGWPKTKIDPRDYLIITETKIDWRYPSIFKIMSLKRAGNWIILEGAFWNPDYPNYHDSPRFEMLCWCDGRRLLLEGGEEYRPPLGVVYLKTG
jgi:hypothetical protein